MNRTKANEVYLGPILLDPDDPDDEGQCIGAELHALFMSLRAMQGGDTTGSTT